MKITRRRLAAGSTLAVGALVAGALVAPSVGAAANGVTVTPSGAQNSNASATLTFATTDADLRTGGTATFTRVGSAVSFNVNISAGTPPAQRSGTGTRDFTDGGSGLGIDGPIDAGQYAVSISGNASGVPGVGGGTDTCASCFAVLPAGPLSAVSVAPSSVRPGAASNISVLGNNFERGSLVEVLLPDGSGVDNTINANQAPVNGGTTETDGITTRTELMRRVTLTTASVPGLRNVRVRNLDGTTTLCTGCFSVAGPALTSVMPSAGFNDPTTTPVNITVAGTQITDGTASLEYLGTPGSASRSQLTITGTRTAYNGTSLSADFLLGNAAPGIYQPVVRSGSGIVNACDACRFTVVQSDSRRPTVSGLDRTGADTGKSQPQGSTFTYDVAGTNFSRGAQVVVSGTGVTTTAVEFVSDTLVRATLATTAAATAGARDVRVLLTDGKTNDGAASNGSNNPPPCTGCFTVTAGAAASPSATPTATTSPTGSPSASPSAGASASPAPAMSARYLALASPARVLDTRANGGKVRRGLIELDLSGQLRDPGATSAVLNLTVANGTARGFLVAYPSGTQRPATSNVNFEPEQQQANEAVVALSADRKVSLFVDSAAAHVIVDLVGSFTVTRGVDTGAVVSNTPQRAFDSRTTGTPSRRGEVPVDLSSLLPSGATDAILNVTVTKPTAKGFVTAYATGTQRPKTSNVNFVAKQTQANEVISRVGTGSNAGKVSLFVDSASAAVIVDLVGAVVPGSPSGAQTYTRLDRPQRAADTRGPDKKGARVRTLDVQMPAQVPSDATAVVLNVTATTGTVSGFVTVFPTGTSDPGTSNVNFPAGLTQANEVTTALGTDRSVTLKVGGANSPAAHLIVDVVGYLTGGTVAGASPQPSASGSASPSPSCQPGTLDPLLGSSCPSGSASPSASGSSSPSASGTPRASGTPTPSATGSPTSAASGSPSASSSPAADCVPGPPPFCL